MRATVDPGWVGSAGDGQRADPGPPRVVRRGHGDRGDRIRRQREPGDAGRRGGSAVFFTFLVVRDFAFHGLGRRVLADLRSPTDGPAYATIPGAINVLAIALVHLVGFTPVTMWVVLVLGAVGTLLGLGLTVVFFTNAFENREFNAEDVSGTWFIPETVLLLGAMLAGMLSAVLPEAWDRSLGVIAFGLLGAGLILFALTATLYFHRLIQFRQDDSGVPSLWIMMSPLSVGALALPIVAASTADLGGAWGGAIVQAAHLVAALMWGFSMWWFAAAALVTWRWSGQPLTFTPADWGFVFPFAAMVLSTLALGRLWESGLMEALGVLLSFALAAVWIVVFVSAIVSLRRARQSAY
ncbi:MAG: hypothetical protein U0R64_02375 [Candidatus Nanopelagicales bacterium]